MGVLSTSPQAVIYPETDDQPMAENTLQFQWIVTIKEGLEGVFAARPDVFVAGDLFWYPAEGEPGICTAPDAMVVLGRPKGHRRSYLQWEEDDIPPAVVFEVLSPGNRPAAMTEKLRFYERYGVMEYYIYDPEDVGLKGFNRSGEKLAPIPEMNGWTSPRLRVRFELDGPELVIRDPDGQPFLTYQEMRIQRNAAARERDEIAVERDEIAVERDEIAAERDAERRRGERLAARLRAAGIDPDE